MRMIFAQMRKMMPVAMAAWSMCGIAGAEQQPPPPDAAAHTVIVPFDPAKPLGDQKADRFYLDYQTFQQLWSQAKEHRRPEKPPADGSSGVTMNLALHEVEVKEDALLVTSRFRIGSRGEWQSIKLPLSSAGTDAADWMLDGRAAPIKEGAILLESPGAHEVEAKVSAGLTRGWQQASLKFPAGVAGLLRVSVPLSDGMPDFGPDAQPSLVAEEVREGRRVFTFALTQGGAVTLKRQAARRASDQTAPAVCEIRSDLVVRPHVEHLQSTLIFRFPGAERTSLSVVLDEDIKPVTWSAANVMVDGNQRITGSTSTSFKEVVIRRENGRLIADIRLMRPVRDQFQIGLTAVRSLANVEGPRTAPSVGAVAARVERTMQLSVSPALKVSASPGSAERIPTQNKGAEPAVGAWRLRNEDGLSYSVSISDESSSAQVEMLAQVGVSKLEIMVAATLKAGRLPLHEAYMRLPQGYEVQSVQGAGLRGWQRDDGGVFVQFDSSVSSEARLVLNAALTRAPGEGAATLPVVFIDGMAKQKAVVFLAVNAAMDVRTQFDRAWRETDPESLSKVFTVSPPWVTKRALVWEPDAATAKQPPAAPVVNLIAQTPKFSADTVLLVRSADESLGFSQQVGITVEQGAVGSLKVRLPASLPEARVGGPDVRDVQTTTQAQTREYLVTFQGDILGTASVTLDWEQAPASEAILPLVSVEGASRSRRFFILENSSSREVKTALTNVEKTVASAVPWLPEGMASADLYQARGAEAEMKLTFSNTQATAGNAAIVTLAEITTALRPNGERWETVVYSLANRSLQFLPVRLPERAELVTVMVGDEMVRADRGIPATVAGDKAAPCHLVPLIQMRAGQLSQQVRLTYFVPAKDGPSLKGTAMMDDPELAGLSAERTLWNVWVPDGYELDEFDGNMEEVVEEVIEDEKVQQKLSDVLRLNRIFSSSNISESDAKEAWGNASKALEEVEQYQQGKKSRSYRASSKPSAKGKAQGKEMDEQVVLKSNQQLEQQLRRQSQLLSENSGKLEKFSKAGAGTLQLQGGSTFSAGKGGVNSWNFNGEASQAKTKESKVVLQGANTVLNDNVAVSNDFLMQQGQGAQVENAPAAGQKPLQAAAASQALTSNVTLNNARGAANFIQTDGGAANLPGDGRVTGQPGMAGANTHTGTTQFSGTLTISSGVTQTLAPPTGPAPASVPAGADPFAPAAGAATSVPAARPATGAGTTTSAGALAVPSTPAPADQPRSGQQRAGSVQESLQSAYSAYNLGDFDRANAAFQDVLRVDPYNTAARRGMERTEQMRSEYFDTARNQTRARMLNEVSRGWEEPVQAAVLTPQLKPQGRVSMPVDVPLTGTVYHFRKLKDHAALELDIEKPLEPGRTMALWFLLVGALALAGIAWLGRKRGAKEWQSA